MRSKTGKNSGSSSGRPLTLVKIWMPLAPSLPMARSISSSEAATLFIGSEATRAGHCSGCFRTISAMPSFASRASSGVSAGFPRNSMAGIDRVRICLYSGKRFIMRMRLSRSHRTGMCIQRLSCAASDGFPSAICFIRSKYGCGKMCGKCRASALLFLYSRHGGKLPPARRLGADAAAEGLAEQRLGELLADVDEALAEIGIAGNRRQLARQPLEHLAWGGGWSKNSKQCAEDKIGHAGI